MADSNNQPIKILAVDDEKDIRDLLEASLNFMGFEVRCAADGEEGLKLATDFQPDLIVLDIMMPKLSGTDVAKKLRDEGNHVPILFLSAKDSVHDKILGLTVGGDDYVVKPFSLEELAARIRTILRRAQLGKTLSDQADLAEPVMAGQLGDGNRPGDRARLNHSILRVANIEVDEDAMEVRKDNEVVELSPTEYRLFHFLVENQGRVVTKNQIFDFVWEYDFGGDAAIIDTYMSYLRKKVGHEIIHTKRGLGYIVK